MAIELKKENLAQREVLIRTGCEVFTDVDIIVPDVKPDVQRILQIDANPVIMETIVHDEKVIFECRLDICILYAGENGCVKSIHTRQDISHQVNNKNISRDMTVEACCSPSRVDSRILNSRKLSVSVTVAIDYCVMRDKEMPIVTGLVADDCQMKFAPVKSYVSEPQMVTPICVRETFDIPQGKPDADEILKLDVRLCNKDIRFAGAKAVVKGELICTVLYVCDVEPASLQTVEYSLPFTEVVDLPDADSDANCDVEYIFKEKTCLAKQDSDGDNRIVYIEVCIDAVANWGREVTVNALCDAYSSRCDLELEAQPVRVEEMVCRTSSMENIKCSVPVPSGHKDIAGVYRVTAVPGVVTAAPDGKSVMVEGELVANILYKTVDPEMPVDSLKHTIPFTCSMEMEGIDERCLFDVKVDVDNVSYNISLPDELELRCNISVGVTAIREVTTHCVTSVEEKPLPEAEPCGAYCVKIYFVRKGDTLWNIAKRYRISTERLMKINNLDGDLIMPGQRLIIA